MPFGVGYDRKKQTWHYTPEIGLVKEMFELYDQQGIRSYAEIARRTGVKDSAIKIILRNEIYTGWRVFNEKRGPKRVSASGRIYRSKVARCEGEIIRNKVLDGIVTVECFERVQRELAIVTFNHLERLRENDVVNIGAGILFCGQCGRPLLCVAGRGEKSGYYHCKANHHRYKPQLGGCKQRNLKSGEVDAAVVELTSTILSNPARLTQILEASAKKSKEVITPFSKVAESSAQLSELAKRDRRILDAYELGAISVDELRSKREAIRREKASLVKVSADKPSTDRSEFLKMARVVVKAAHRFSALADRRTQKAIVHELLAEAHVRDSCVVSFRLRPSLLIGAKSEEISNSIVLLPEPIVIGKPPDILPAGHRRCIKCSEVKPVAQFYRNLNRCNPCRHSDQRQRDLRQKSRVAP
ncbi:MAG: recombinase family protein [Prosthecobacter sp.]|nr:recombinase family protein [Prosthecobacter sp.]